MWLVVLTGFLAPLGVLASWNTIATRRKTFYVLFLLQQVAMLGIFVALDLFLYYAFWELSLVPMTILIATFGRTEDRRRAAIKYFLYAFIPSALLLVGMLWLYAQDRHVRAAGAGQAGRRRMRSRGNADALWLCSLAFLLAFAVKVPIFPLHGWLKDAIAEAPTAAVMVLAGKTGLYSILRFSFAIFPEQSHRIAPLMIALGAIGIVYGVADRAYAQGPEEAGGLLHAGAPVVHHAGHLHLHRGRHRRRHLPDPEPRHLWRRACSCCSASCTSAMAPTTCAISAAWRRSCRGW